MSGVVMKGMLCLVMVGLVLSSCAGVPAMVKTSRGEVFEGTGTNTVVGGTYSMYSKQGKTLTGSYASVGRSGEAVFKFTITDGRSGRVNVKKLTESSGYGLGTLTSGERCRFMYGDAAISKYSRAGF